MILDKLMISINIVSADYRSRRPDQPQHRRTLRSDIRFPTEECNPHYRYVQK